MKELLTKLIENREELKKIEERFKDVDIKALDYYDVGIAESMPMQLENLKKSFEALSSNHLIELLSKSIDEFKSELPVIEKKLENDAERKKSLVFEKISIKNELTKHVGNQFFPNCLVLNNYVIKKKEKTMDEMKDFCKEKGFLFKSSGNQGFVFGVESEDFFNQIKKSGFNYLKGAITQEAFSSSNLLAENCVLIGDNLIDIDKLTKNDLQGEVKNNNRFKNKR